MFERFTARGRRVVVLAQEQARTLNHNYIGTEHLLLAFIEEGEGIAAQALQLLGLSLEGLHAEVAKLIGVGQGAPSGHIPFTPRAKKVLELSLREALQLGHDHIGTEHLLLGLVREGEGSAARILATSGIELARVRQAVIRLLVIQRATPVVPPPEAQVSRVQVIIDGKVDFDEIVERYETTDHHPQDYSTTGARYDLRVHYRHQDTTVHKP